MSTTTARTDDVRLPDLPFNAPDSQRQMNDALYAQFRDGNQRIWALEQTVGISPRRPKSGLDTVILNVKAYGAIGNGVADDTTAIQKAITAATAGAMVYFPPGSYLISSALTVTVNFVTLRGSGQSSIIVSNHLTADLITVGDGTNSIAGFVCRSIALEASVVKTAGYALNIRIGTQTRIENVFISDSVTAYSLNMKHGIYFDRFDYSNVTGCTIYARGTCISARGKADQSFGAGLYITGGCKLYANNTANSVGISLGGACGGVVVDQTDVIQCATGIWINTTLQAAINNREVFIGSGATLDGCAGNGLFAETLAISFLCLRGVWVASNGAVTTTAAGILVNASAAVGGTTVDIAGCRIYNNGGNGIELNGVSATIAGNTIHGNGIGAGGGSGISFSTQCLYFTVAGNKITVNGAAGVGYGINVSALCDEYAITGNYFIANAVGAINDLGGPTKNLFANTGYDTGYVSKNIKLVGNLARGIVTKTASPYSVLASDTSIICNLAGIMTLTLPNAALEPVGREILIRTITANTVISASANVIPLVGGGAGTAILAATAGKWALLVNDGGSWQIMAAN